MTVRSILDTKGHNILSVEPDAKLSAAVKILGERKIGAVWYEPGKVDGILSERDIVRVLAERGAKCGRGRQLRDDAQGRQLPAVGTVGGIMEMMTIASSASAVLEDGKVVGLISIGDVVKWRVQEYEREQEALRDYIKTA